ncbi:MAG: GNAT family N-acetyltransferase [Thermoplasmataceae archaeon]
MNETEIALLPISENDFREYLEAQILVYAREKVKAGSWIESEALDLSRKSFKNLLPDGKETEGHSIMNIVNVASEEYVGVLWVEWNNRDHRSTYVWDIIIYEEFRQKGYGSLALKSLEKMAREKGSLSITLHVFGHNKPALAMYSSLGYHSLDIIMRKDL